MTDLVAALDRIEARKLTDHIKDTGMFLRKLIIHAWEGRAWAALGYDSWDDYCAQEFSSLELELPRDERREIVVSLRESGMSLRAIAAATGVSHPTVITDLNSGGKKTQENLPPEDTAEDAPVWYCEGGGHDVLGVVPAEQVGSRLCCPPCAEDWRQPIKGRDGKTYPAPKPAPPSPPTPTPKPRTMLTLYTHEGTPVPYPKPSSASTFNQTSGAGISWAEWSWNPVTGCLHGCDYCYAREIATSNRATATYPVGFTPLFHHERLAAPANTVIPAKHTDNAAYRRVFVCSMADLYGRWVPQDWIDQVHAAMLDSPQWQYITLTKFPDRYPGLKMPDGAWVGTSVDEQKRVRIAERAFRELPVGVVKWLSLEPLREPLGFEDLSMFDWVVIGAQTETRQPSGVVPAFAPPFEWVARIIAQAREVGCRIHMKPNLIGRVSPSSPGMALLNEYPVD